MPHSRSRRPTPLHEFQLIKTLHRRYGTTGPHVVRGIGDDAAVVTPIKGHELVVTTDLLAEGVHFDHKTATFQDIGYKAAVASLSDIAAMGAKPDYLLVSLAIPSSRTASDIQRLYHGLMLACRPHGVELIGGDTSASRQGLFVNIVLIGSIPSGRALTRDGAQVGDLLYVTGTIGDALAGLRLLSLRPGTKGSLLGTKKDPAQGLIRRHLRPTPRVTVGQILSAQRLATSAIDLSDGLSGDLRHMCEQSHVGAQIDRDALPISSALRRYADMSKVDPVDVALQGGEDYELLFTVAHPHGKKVEQLGRQVDCRLSCIGIIKPEAYGFRIKDHSGSVRRLPMLSYQHFHPKAHNRPEGLWSR
ncbi:MAG: thiamine-phosphate kinase [Nitrospirales bacterium]|nr:thiamine-phosphate kinase [Nitrospirales bacterium]